MELYGDFMNALTYYFLNKIDNQGNPINPLLVHRIDKDTSTAIGCQK